MLYLEMCGLHLRWLPLKYSEYAPLPQPTPPRGDPQTLTDRSGSVLWAHCSFPLGPGAHKVLFVPSKSLFLQSCVSSGSSVVVLMATPSKRAYAMPRSAAPRAPAGHY